MWAALEANLGASRGQGLRDVEDPSLLPGWKGEGKVEVSSLCSWSQNPPPASL